jgi:hypothetical protein
VGSRCGKGMRGLLGEEFCCDTGIGKSREVQKDATALTRSLRRERREGENHSKMLGNSKNDEGYWQVRCRRRK